MTAQILPFPTRTHVSLWSDYKRDMAALLEAPGDSKKYIRALFSYGSFVRDFAPDHAEQLIEEFKQIHGARFQELGGAA